jgi:hypothetical protein
VVLFFHVTSGLADDPYQNLLAAKGGSGWPFVAILDATGRVLAHHEGERETAQFEQTLASATETAASLAELEQLAKGGDVTAAGQLLELNIDLGHVDAGAARHRLALLDALPKPDRDRLEKRIIKAEVASIQISATSDVNTQIAAGEKFAEMVAAGRIPEDPDAMFFWYFTAMYAERAEQTKLYARALEGLRHHEQRLGAGLLESMEKTLKKLGGKP